MSKLSVLVAMLVATVLFCSQSRAAKEECRAGDAECGKQRIYRGESRIGPKGGPEPEEQAAGDDAPRASEELIDTSDPKNWPKARYPDIDLSGELQEVDLSGYVFDEDEGKPQRPKTETEEDPNKELDQEAAEMKAFGELVTRLEVVANEYACTVSAVPLFQISGDDLVFRILSDTVSKSLKAMGQEFGAQMIKNWETEHVAGNYSCEGIARFDQSKFDHPVTFLLEAKALFTSWLKKRDIEPSELIDLTIPVIRSLFGKWFVARLMVAAPTTTDGKVVFPDSLAEALIPFVKDDDKPRDTCIAAAGLYAVFLKGATRQSTSIADRINRLIDICYTAGKSSDKPSEFGKHLLGTGREKEARELFELAVQRGELCHPLQRPENFHRKELTVRAIWHESAFPELQKLPQFAATVAEKLSSLHFYEPANHIELLGTGSIEIAPLHSTSALNETNCAALGEQACATLKELIELILDSNDSYLFSCNGTFSLEVWKIAPPAQSPSDTGMTNMVVQVLTPVAMGEGNTFALRVGDEAVLLEPNQMIIFDDSFENQLEVTTTEESAPQPLYLLHAQLCHPDLHAKALRMPSKKCVSQHTDNVKV